MNVSSLFSTAIPSFVLGLVLIFFFAVDLRIFPPGGYVAFSDDPLGNIRDLILPMITLGAGAVAVNMRQIRASMIEAARTTSRPREPKACLKGVWLIFMHSEML